MNSLIKLIVVLFIVSHAKGQNVQPFFPEANLITTGIYYYMEHWNENRIVKQ
jgi:beta-galactosidase